MNSTFAPRLKIEAANAVMSQITPPPIPTNMSLRVKSASTAAVIIERTDSIVLYFSQERDRVYQGVCE